MRKLFASILFSTLLTSTVHADSLVITDTSGVTRAEQSLTPETSNSSVQFSVADASGNPAEGFDVILKNELTGETLTAYASGGSVVFDSVPAGTWVVSTTAPGITFTGVTIAPALVAGALGGAGLTSGVVIVGGLGAVAATAVAISENNNDDPEMSPSS